MYQLLTSNYVHWIFTEEVTFVLTCCLALIDIFFGWVTTTFPLSLLLTILNKTKCYEDNVFNFYTCWLCDRFFICTFSDKILSISNPSGQSVSEIGLTQIVAKVLSSSVEATGMWRC